MHFHNHANLNIDVKILSHSSDAAFKLVILIILLEMGCISKVVDPVNEQKKDIPVPPTTYYYIVNTYPAKSDWPLPPV